MSDVRSVPYGAAAADAREGNRTEEFMLFQAGGKALGVALTFVRSIHRVNELAGPPPGDVMRHCVLNDREMPLYNLSRLLGRKGQATGRKVICLAVRGTALALQVDTVERVAEAERHRIVPLPPVFTGQSARCFPRVLRHEERLILLLDPTSFSDLQPEPTPGDNGTGNEVIDLTDQLMTDDGSHRPFPDREKT